MKLTTILAALLMSATLAFSQGSIVFNNRVTGQVVTHIYGPEPGATQVPRFGNGATDFPVGSQTYGGALLAGTGFTVQLWGGPSGTAPNLLTLAAGNGTATFRTGAAAGFISQPSGLNPTINGVPENSAATIQLRAWDNAGGTITTWAAAMASTSTAHGASLPFVSPVLGGATVTSPNLIGLTSFNLQVVPEPSIVALGVLGLGALFLRRRK